MSLSKVDLELFDLIEKEQIRQQQGLELIPSENYASPAVREAMSSVLTNKYSEGYPKKRYYGGNDIIDDVEMLAIDRAKRLFGTPHANVQPYSGSPANLAVYVATCNPGDTIMGLNLPDGGHLTHGWKVSVTSQFYNSISYHVQEDGRVNLEEVERLAHEHKPKLIWIGATAYVYEYEFEEFARIADSVGAYLAADIAHVAGLVIGGVHKNPTPHVHMVTTTTHKTLRGPRGGMILVTDKGLQKDPLLAQKVDKAVFPGLQGGPHDHTTAAIAVALHEASQPAFITYAKQIIANSKALAATLVQEGLTLVGGGTENHLILVNLVPQLGPGGGIFVQEALDRVGITLNKNTIPNDPSSPFYPSGIRLGTPAATTRGMKEKEMVQIGHWVAHLIREVSSFRLPQNKEERIACLHAFREKIWKNTDFEEMARDVQIFCSQHPLP